jgi:hypothetical protein
MDWHAALDDFVRDEHSDVGRTLDGMLEETLWAAELLDMRVEVQESRAVAEVEDLLLDPAWPLPFISDRRTRGNVVRIWARSGVRYLLTHQVWERIRFECPLCKGQSPEAGGSIVKRTPFTTVPHIFRDCPYLESKRREAVEQAAVLAQHLGIAGTCVDHEGAWVPATGAPDARAAQHRHQWYRLMMGASVPPTFLRCPGVFRTIDNVRAPAADRLAEALTSYRRVLTALDAFVVHANEELREASGLSRDLFTVHDMLE